MNISKLISLSPMRQILCRLSLTLRRKYTPFFLKEKSNIIDELAEYLELPKEKLLWNFEHGEYLAKKEWIERNPQSHQEIIQFYSQTEYYLYDLVQGSYSLGAIIYRDQIAKMCKGRVLDYGGGIGDMIIRASQYCEDLTYYDVSGNLFNYAKWRFERRNLEVQTIEASDVEDRLKGEYDTITCLSVLEHCVDPLLHLKRMKKHLSRDGRVFVVAYFGKSEAHPMHFDSHKTLEEYLVLVGLKKRNYCYHWKLRLITLLLSIKPGKN